MSTINLQEKLLFYTRRKSVISDQLSKIQMQYLSASRQNIKDTQAYNAELQEAYYDDQFGYGTPEYCEILEALNVKREHQQATLTAWETQLDVQKDSLETQLSEITQFEQSWQKMLQQNIQKDFSYGGGGGK